MPIFKVPNQSFRWLFAELAVVVLGILIAFQIDAWNTNRVASGEEIAALQGILRDLEPEMVDAERVQNRFQRTADNARELIDHLDNAEPRSEEYIAELWTIIISMSSWNAASPTYDGLRENGNLDLIANNDLQRRLHEYYEDRSPGLIQANTTAVNIIQDMINLASKDIFLYSFPSAPRYANLQIVKVENSPLGGGGTRYVALPSNLDEIPSSFDWIAELNRIEARYTGLASRAELIQETIREISHEIDSYLAQVE